ncbi:MAG: Dyp-type peroxidase [Desertimonas sp.]
MSSPPPPQPGILAFGTTHHAYVELDLIDGTEWTAIAAGLAGLTHTMTPGSGCMMVLGVRPSLWRRVRPDVCPSDVHDFADAVVGDDGFTMPATQHDLCVWLAGSAQDVVFDEVLAIIAALAPFAAVATEEVGWTYRYHRDLTGFVDGTENPKQQEVGEVAIIPDGPAAGASVLLLQKWPHDPSWQTLPVEAQEAAIGRTKADDIELDPKPVTSHAARTDQDELGKIVRRNLGYGRATDHGTMFVGMTKDQSILERMLARMAGCDGEPRDELTRYSRAVTGAYYVLPKLADVVG